VSGFREQLNRIPKPVAVGVAVVLCGLAVWSVFALRGSDDYYAGPARLKCSACGHEWDVSIDELTRMTLRAEKNRDEPTDEPLFFKCPSCGDRKARPIEEFDENGNFQHQPWF
jgi:uncharacterized protein YlaI